MKYSKINITAAENIPPPPPPPSSSFPDEANDGTIEEPDVSDLDLDDAAVDAVGEEEEEPYAKLNMALEDLKYNIDQAGAVDVGSPPKNIREIARIKAEQNKIKGQRSKKINFEEEDYQKRLEKMKKSGTLEDLMKGLNDALGDDSLTEEEKQDIEKYVKEQRRVWTYLTKNEQTTVILDELIALYYQLNKMGNFVGEYYDVNMMSLDNKDLRNLLSPAGFFRVLNFTSDVKTKAKDKDEIIKVRPDVLFSEYIYTATYTPKKTDKLTPNQIKMLRNKKQRIAEELGGFVEEKLKEILLVLQKFVDKKLEEDANQAFQGELPFLTPYFAYTETGEKNDEGIQVANLGTKNNGAQFIQNIISTSSGYVLSVIMKSVFKKDTFQEMIEDKAKKDKLEETALKEEEKTFLNLSEGMLIHLVEKLITLPDNEINLDSELGKFIFNLYSTYSKPGNFTEKERRQQGIEIPNIPNNIIVYTSSGSNTITILSDIIDEKNKMAFYRGEAPFDLPASLGIKRKAELASGQIDENIPIGNEPPPNQDTKEILDKLFMYAKVFKITDNSIINQNNKIAHNLIKEKRNIVLTLPLLFGRNSIDYMNALIKHREEKKKQKEQASVEATKATQKKQKKQKKEKITKDGLMKIINTIYGKKNDNDFFNLLDQFLIVLNDFIKNHIKDETQKGAYSEKIEHYLEMVADDKKPNINGIIEIINNLNIK